VIAESTFPALLMQARKQYAQTRKEAATEFEVDPARWQQSARKQAIWIELPSPLFAIETAKIN